MRFSDLDLGDVDAKMESHLPQYFVDTHEFEQVASGRAAFIVGRKGTGKTAILRMLYARQSSDTFVTLLSLADSPSRGIFDASDGSLSPNQFVSIWRFLIAYEACKLVLRDESVSIIVRDQLTRFLRDNFEGADAHYLDAISTLKRRAWTLGVRIPLFDVPGAEFTTSQADADQRVLHYSKAADLLMAYLLRVRSSNHYLLLFDDLDVDYRDEPRYFDLVVSLLRAIYETRATARDRIRVWPVAALREDIFDRLDDHDMSKWNDRVVRLRWSSERDPHSLSLRTLVDRRLEVALDAPRMEDYWGAVVREEEWGGPNKSAWDFHVERTRLRPRDILKSLMVCQRFEGSDRLGVDAVATSMHAYGEWLHGDIGSELFRVLSDYRKVIDLLRVLGEGFAIDDWRAQFNANPTIASASNAESALAVLYEFGVVGLLGKHGTIFKFAEPQVPFDIAARYAIHPGLRRYLPVPVEAPRSKEMRIQGKPVTQVVGDQVATSTEPSAPHRANGTSEPRLGYSRSLAVVVVADIVGSTTRAFRMGDERWASLMGAVRSIVDDAVTLHAGVGQRVVGDEFVAAFPMVLPAIECAMAIQAACAKHDLHLRVGLHAGAVDLIDQALRGIAVHVASRVASLAAGDEVLVTDTVRDLVVDPRLEFIDRGRHPLKGVPEMRQVFLVRLRQVEQL